jgi:orotate phosphoribosyltransferase
VSDAAASPVGAPLTPAADALRQRLLAQLAERSAKQGDFVLASGRRSTLYVDCRLTTMSPDGQLVIGRLGLAALAARGWAPDSVGGLTLGADPIAYAIAHASALSAEAAAAGGNGAPPLVRAFTVRKQPKQHGTGQRIEGPFRRGDRVVVVEDVITTGGSALNAVAAVREAGAEVIGVLAVVDREEGGREALEAEGLPVAALARAAELVARLGG